MITIKNLLEWEAKFLKKLKNKGKSANSLKSYRLDFECLHLFIENLPSKKITDFNSVVLKEFEFFLKEKYPKINSRRRKLQTLRLFFDYLIEHGMYQHNPIKNMVSAPKSLLPPSPVKYPTVFQINSIFKEEFLLQNQVLQKLIALRNQCVLRLIYHAGLSVSILSQVKKKDLLFQKDQLRVLVRPKKRDPYSIPIPDVDFFRFYIKELEKFSTEKDFEEVLFFANAHTILRGGFSPRGIEDLFHKISKKINEDITPKKIRQSCITRWILEGHSDTKIKEWMGVAPSYSLSAFKKYIKAQKEDDTSSKDFLDYKELPQ